MEWWQFVVSVASIIITGIASWSLKELIAIKIGFAEFKKWAEQKDMQFAAQAVLNKEFEKRFGWGSSKIGKLVRQNVALLQFARGLEKRIEKLEEK